MRKDSTDVGHRRTDIGRRRRFTSEKAHLTQTRIAAVVFIHCKTTVNKTRSAVLSRQMSMKHPFRSGVHKVSTMPVVVLYCRYTVCRHINHMGPWADTSVQKRLRYRDVCAKRLRICHFDQCCIDVLIRANRRMMSSHKMQ